MYEQQIESIVGDFVSDIDVTRFSNETIIQFGCEWPIDRISDHIKSAICLNKHGSVTTIELRPGHFPQNAWSYSEVQNLVESTLNHVGGMLSDESTIKIYSSDNLWRVHIQCESPSSFSTVVEWTRDVLETYNQMYVDANKSTINLYPFLPGREVDDSCFQCGNHNANFVCTSLFTENEELHLLVCEECVSTVVSFPFVKPAVSVNVMRESSVVSTGDDFSRVGAITP